MNTFSTKKIGEVESSESGVPTAPAQSEEGLKQGELADPMIKRKENNLAKNNNKIIIAHRFKITANKSIPIKIRTVNPPATLPAIISSGTPEEDRRI